MPGEILMEPIILASSSPRRQEILKLMNIPFKVIMPTYKEEIPEGMEVEKIPEFFAAKKVESVAKSIPNEKEIPWILGADTMVTLNGKIYGKPESPDQARQFLHELKNKTHKVITGIALYNGALHFVSSRTVISEVTFSNMSGDEINWYVNTGEWHGAAGGYRIQELASCFIKKIKGTNSAVVGLPVFDLYDMLKEQGYSIID